MLAFLYLAAAFFRLENGQPLHRISLFFYLSREHHSTSGTTTACMSPGQSFFSSFLLPRELFTRVLIKIGGQPRLSTSSTDRSWTLQQTSRVGLCPSTFQRVATDSQALLSSKRSESLYLRSHANHMSTGHGVVLYRIDSGSFQDYVDRNLKMKYCFF